MVKGNENNLILNKMNYIDNLNKDLRKKINEKAFEIIKLEKDFKEKIEIEEEKHEITKRQVSYLEKEIATKNQNIKNLIESNKNLLSQIKMLITSNDELKKNSENKTTEIDFIKSELGK